MTTVDSQTGASLREAALKAMAEYQRADAERRRQDLERERARATIVLERALREIFGDLAAGARIEFDNDADIFPIATLDGMRFMAGSGWSYGNYGLKFEYPCPDCGTPIWSEDFSDLQGLGFVLTHPSPAHGEHGRWHECPVKSVPADAEQVNQTPKPGKPGLAAVIEQLVREIVRDELLKREES